MVVAAFRSRNGASNLLLRWVDRRLAEPLCCTALSREETRNATGLGLEDVAPVMRGLAALSEGVDIAFRNRPALAGAADQMALEVVLNGKAEAIGDAQPRGFSSGPRAGRNHCHAGRDHRKTANMKQAQRYKYPLQPPPSLKQTAVRLAREDGVSLNQWIVAAVARQIGAVETAAAFLKARAGMAKRGDPSRLLDRAPDVPAPPEDAIDSR